jgi:hypothetical protein
MEEEPSVSIQIWVMRKKKRSEQSISDVLREYLGQRTVLGVAIPVLSAHIEAAESGSRFQGLSERQIQQGFRELVGRFIKSDYHSTYIDRRLGRRGFLELSGDRYRIRATLLEGIALNDLKRLRDELVASLKSAYEQRQAVIKQLEAVASLPGDCVDERRELIDSYLSQLSGNRGEVFEVMSFAVLREYFHTFGFSLKRFSTTHANDGGMDFVAGEAIYQVTTDESAQKLQRDLAKAPGTKRVLVRPTMNSQILGLSGGDVLETLELRDLLSHFIAWLLARDTRSRSATHLQEVLRIALYEFQRENKAASET